MSEKQLDKMYDIVDRVVNRRTPILNEKEW